MKRFVAELDEQSYEVEILDDGTVIVAGAPGTLAVRAAGRGVLRVAGSDRQRTVFVAASGSHRWAFVDGAVFEATISTRGDYRRRPAAHYHESLSAPMPATVVQLVAPPGTTVRKGDVVILLEAMKMELPILAPHDGTVEAVHCRAGDLVQPGVPLVDLEELDEA
jgi:biotin carboxyl carrier protein